MNNTGIGKELVEVREKCESAPECTEETGDLWGAFCTFWNAVNRYESILLKIAGVMERAVNAAEDAPGYMCEDELMALCEARKIISDIKGGT